MSNRPSASQPPDGAAYRFFFDENLLPVGRHLAKTRNDVLHPDHPGIPEVRCGAKDFEWLPIVGARRLVLITRDKRIRREPAELLHFQRFGVRGFVLTGKNELSRDQKIALIERRWRAIEQHVIDSGPGPWMAGLDNNGRIRSIRLPRRPA
ncbi:MAG: hypothetical protein S0880_11320 [Actinomycetota bacterium]|nr:hypothetical protein [Actinomycetota bacterium]